MHYFKEKFDIWRKNLSNTEYEEQINSMVQDDDSISDSFYKDLEFGTAGMRGEIGLGTNRMNVFTVKRCTLGLAKYILKTKQQDRGVAIAYDTRKFSNVFAKEAAMVLAHNKIKVFLYETPHSVPQLSYTILKLNCIAGIVITASHNPAIYNGYKVYGEDGGQLSVENSDIVTNYINKIEDIFDIKSMPIDDAIKSGIVKYIGKEIDEDYYADVESLVLDEKNLLKEAGKLNVVYTPLHGTGLVPLTRVLGDLGVHKLQIVEEQTVFDHTFPTVKAPNPEERQSYDLAIALANKCNANLILATDPDADRLGVAVRDEKDEFIILSGNQIGCLILDYLLTVQQNSFKGDEFVVKSIVSTDMADVIAKKFNVEMRGVFTGFKYIAEQIKISKQTKKGSFVFGFEESYGYLQGTFVRDKDAVQAAMLMVEAACYFASKNKTVYQAVCDLYDKYGYFEEVVLSKTLTGKEGIEKIKNAVVSLRNSKPTAFGSFKVEKIRDYQTGLITDFTKGTTTDTGMEKADVLYYELENARFIVRASGTEPKLKTYLSVCTDAKQTSVEMLNKLKEETTVIIDDLLK